LGGPEQKLIFLFMFWTSQFFGKKEKKEKEFVPSAAANDGI
jgi:hypothetical protein